MARRLETALDISAGFWLRMQSDYDLKLAEQEPDPVIVQIEDILAIQRRSNTSLAKALVAYEVAHHGSYSGWAIKSGNGAAKVSAKTDDKSAAVASSSKHAVVKARNVKKTH